MNIHDAVKLVKEYETCPKCGCSTIGGGTGTLEFDTERGYFKRTCSCGWSVEVIEREESRP